MSDTENETVTTPKKFKLRRIKPKPNEDIIQKNLEPLKHNVLRKKMAQQAYYRFHPFIRNSSKGPVHQRLGNRIQFHGTNTSAIPPKRRLRLPGANFQNNKRQRMTTLQSRINRIRGEQSLSTKRIRLRRTIPSNRQPSNLRVQFNNVAVSSTNYIKRFKMHLDPGVQQEIAKIQQEFQGEQTIAPVRIKPMSTSISTNERFSVLQ